MNNLKPSQRYRLFVEAAIDSGSTREEILDDIHNPDSRVYYKPFSIAMATAIQIVNEFYKVKGLISYVTPTEIRGRLGK